VGIARLEQKERGPVISLRTDRLGKNPRYLRSTPPTVKIIAASGLNANESVAKVAGAGVKHFLTKPSTAGTLLKIMRAILDEA
jgi:CheY-like chemotaxis protein